MKKYKTFSIDKEVLLDSLHHNGRCEFRLNIDSENDWTVEININDMRSHDYKSCYTSESGTSQHSDTYVPNTYKGKTSDGQIVRLTIDDDEFWGVILDAEKQIVIRQTKDYTNNKADKSLILFDKSNLIASSEHSDIINDALTAPDFAEDVSKNTKLRAATLCTYYLKVATDADYELYQNRGSNVTETYSYIFSVLNLKVHL